MQFNCAHDALIELDKLQPNPKNPNNHPAKQIDLLAKIIDYQGQRSPIVVSNRSGFIVKGHGRLAALRSLGWDKAAIDYQDYDNEAQEWADLNADNKIAELAKYDDQLFIEGIKELDLGDDFDLELFGVPDLEIVEADPAKEEIEDDVPTDVDTRCKPGDIWILGQHRVMCGDSTDVLAVEKLLEGAKADLCFTDPPYGIDVVKDGKNSAGAITKGKLAKAGEYKPIANDNSVDAFKDAWPLMVQFSNNQIVWGSNYFTDILPVNGHWLVWSKRGYDKKENFSGAELAWTSIKKQSVKLYSFVWDGMWREGERKDELKNRVHPTQKPVGLFCDIFADFEFNSCLDLFGGSGSTLIACEKTNRKCYMMELDPHYCDVILSRWEKYADKQAVLESKNET